MRNKASLMMIELKIIPAQTTTIGRKINGIESYKNIFSNVVKKERCCRIHEVTTEHC
jgi:hypothetical protein